MDPMMTKNGMGGTGTGDPVPLFACPLCSIVYGTEGAAVEHAQQCTGTFYGVIFQCAFCEAGFAETDVCDGHVVTCPQRTEGNRDTTCAFLDEMELRYETFKSMTPGRKRVHWEEMSRKFGMTAEEARIKWSRLLYSHKRLVDNAGAKKTGRGSAPKWIHSEQMGRILGSNPALTPRFVLSSIDSPAETASSSSASEPLREVASPAQPSLAATPSPVSLPAVAAQTPPVTTPKSRPQARAKRVKSRTGVIEEYLQRKEEREEEYFREKKLREEKRLQVEEQKLQLLQDIANRLSERRS